MAGNAMSFDLSPVLVQLSGAVTFVASVVLGILHLNRRASKTQTEIKGDKAEQNILDTALKQRDEALAAASSAWAQRLADATEIAGLRAEKLAWIDERGRLSQEFRELESKARRACRELEKIDPGKAALLFPPGWMEFNEGPQI